jgi:hypothetical protein
MHLKHQDLLALVRVTDGRIQLLPHACIRKQYAVLRTGKASAALYTFEYSCLRPCLTNCMFHSLGILSDVVLS